MKTIQQAMTYLTFTYPLYTEYVLYTKIIQSPNLPTYMGIKATSNSLELYINPSLCEKLDLKDIVEILKHEYAHVLLLHLWSILPNHELDNIAADLEINQYPWIDIDGFVTKIGYTPKKLKLENEKNREWYYAKLQNQKSKSNLGGSPVDVHFFDPNNEAVEQVWRQINQRIVEQAKQRGWLPGDVISKLEVKLKREPSIKQILRRLLGKYYHEAIYEAPSRLRPNRRYKLLPGELARYSPRIVIAVDTSGSMSDTTLENLLSVLRWATKRMSIDIVQCDAEISDVKKGFKFNKTINVKGRGGTDFRPVFKYIKEKYKDKIDLLVYATDLYGEFPKEAPQYDVIWLTEENEKAPFGKIIKVKTE